MRGGHASACRHLRKRSGSSIYSRAHRLGLTPSRTKIHETVSMLERYADGIENKDTPLALKVGAVMSAFAMREAANVIRGLSGMRQR